MNQVTKTLCFVGAAIASTVLAFASRPTPEKIDALTAGVVELCPDYKDPLTAKSLKIIRFDETLASLSEIEVKESNGLWTLPSHDGYPADAENRIRDATTPFIELKSLSVITDNEGEHAIYGVSEPSPDKSTVGDQGVGTLVTVEDGAGNKLVNLIIGKEVKDNAELRYVRQPGRSRVYVAKVDPKTLPVRFEDWIDKDLLQLNAWDIHQLVLKDYTFQVAATLTGPVTDFEQRLEMTVTDDNGTWNLNELLIAENDRLQPSALKEGERLSADRLNGLKEALDGLEIVNVERKPENLGADLRAEKGFANDQAGIESLLRRGFYPVSMPGGAVEVLSAEGEVLCRTKEGVEYVLRFGGVEGVDTESDEGKLNRFLLVSARVDEAHFPEPELETLPETIEQLQQAQPAESESSPPAGNETSSATPARSIDSRLTLPVSVQPDAEGDAAAADVEADTPDETPAAATKDPATDAADEPTVEDAAVEDAAVEDAAVGDAAVEDAAVEDAAVEDAAAETPAAEEPAAGQEQAPAAEPVDWQAKLQSERERITKDNQRKIDERNDQLAKARDKVRELNYRFADWYYVISEDIYKKIHLSHTDIIEPIPAEEPQDAAGDGTPLSGPPGLDGLQIPPGFGNQ